MDLFDIFYDILFEMESFFFVYIIVVLIISCIMGAITKTINENKGYDGGFAWGFWLGAIGIIVVACRQPAYRPSNPSTSHPTVQTPSSDGWKCRCGRYNPNYVTTCVCNATKRDMLTAKPVPVSSPAPTPVSTSSAAPVDEMKNIAVLKEYKELLDAGVITQEEFDAKKKSILSR